MIDFTKLTGMSLAKMQSSMDAVGCVSSFFSPINVLSRLEAGKWGVEHRNGFPAFTSDTGVRVLPQPTQEKYFEALMEWIGKRPILLIPEYMAEVFNKKNFRVTKNQAEYFMFPEKTNLLPGGSLRKMRGDVSRAMRVTDTSIEASLKNVDELVSVTDAWYKEASDRLWRPSEKALTVWIIRNWDKILNFEPSARCSVVRDNADNSILSFEMGSKLSGKLASSFTQRSLRDRTVGHYAGVNLINSLALIKHFHCPLNDGPAATADLAHRKLKLCSNVKTFYDVAMR